MSLFDRLSFSGLLVVFASAVVFVGCGSDTCSDAADKLEECGLDAPDIEDDEPECDGRVECDAQCMLDACTCEDLEGTGAEASEACLQCLLDCVSNEE